MSGVCVHGHFYQPPREDPWTGEIGIQPSAAPFPDWNHRITAECYRPNLAAAIPASDGTVATANNFAQMSFDIGPTLMTWLHVHAPDTHDGIVAADQRSVERLGHGGAMAQGYHHVILPLANDRDRVTEVCWGLADFAHRFGRRAQGMWLPETAVDTATLEALTAQGVAFTVLAPGQAHSERILGQAAFIERDPIDSCRPYRVNLPSGRSIAVFFYDGGLARGVAFDGLLHDGGHMATTIAGRLDHGGLVHLATDGESYGHHHRHGEMALAFCLKLLADRQVPVTNYAAYLAHHPPVHEARIQEETSWSCAHGVGRWSANCGCAMRPDRSGDHQWRRILREALNAHRDRMAAGFEARVGGWGVDPWALRDAFIEVRLQPDRWSDFCQTHGLSGRSAEALEWLECQRHALMMFTSCGWFFDDPAGIETVQILRYACRAGELYQSLSGIDVLPDLVADLKPMRSSEALADGQAIWRERVLANR